MNYGWIALHRQIRDNKFYSNPNALAIWIECLLRANHESKDFYSKRELVHLEPGQFTYGESELAAKFGISRQTARYWMDQFSLDGMIDIKRTRKGTICTIKNWLDYQSVDHAVDNKKTTKRQQKDTNNNVNNATKISKDITKESFGKPEINQIIAYMEAKLGHSLDGTKQTNRNMANHLINKIKKEIPNRDVVEVATAVIDLALADSDFHARNATNIGYIYRNIAKIINTAKKTSNLQATIIS